MICSRMALSFVGDTLKGLQLQYVVPSNCNSKVPGSVLFRRLKSSFKNIKLKKTGLSMAYNI